MTVIRSNGYHRGVAWVLRWGAFYTRDLDPRVAGERLDELAADLHDHATWAHEAGKQPGEIEREIVGRGIRGVISDLSWRRAELKRTRRSDPLAFRMKRQGDAALAIVSTISSVLLLSGGYALTRSVVFWVHLEKPVVIGPIIGLGVSVLLSLVGLLLFVRPRTRFLGALSTMLASIGIVLFGFAALNKASMVAQVVGYLPAWPLLVIALSAGLAGFFLAASVWWWPERASTASALRLGEES